MKKPAASVVLLAMCVVTSRVEADTGASETNAPAKWGGQSTANKVSDAKGLPADLSAVEPLWELQLGSHQYTIPTIDRGRLFVGANDIGLKRPGVKRTGGGVLLCVDQATAKLIWQFVTPRYYEGIQPPYHFNQWKCGVCSSPVVDGDRVYIVGGRGEILCLDREGQTNGNDGPFVDELSYMNSPDGELQPTDGDVVWRYNLLTELEVIPHDVCGSTLLLDGDFLYACTSNGLDDRHHLVANPEAPSLIVLDKRTGKLVALEREKISERTLHCNWSSPVLGRVGGKTLIFFGGGDGILYAFEPPSRSVKGEAVEALEKVWAYDCNPREYRWRDGQPVRYSKHNNRKTDGPSEIIATPVFHRGRVYVAIGQSPIHGPGQGHLSCVDAATGEKVWSSKLVDRTLATVSIADGLLYIVDYSGNLHCFDADSGERHWVHDLEAPTWCASTFVADGKVYASNERKMLWVLKAGKTKEVLSRTRYRTPPITLTAADGVLYVPTQQKLIAYPGSLGAP